jgi:hypothetical protein
MGRYLDICKDVTRDRWAKRAATLLATVHDRDLRTDLRDRFEERVAICEYDGNLNRDEAERLAFDELRRELHGRTA